MIKFLIIFLLIFNIYNQALSSKKDGVISKLEETYNLSFNFKQTIDEYNEEGRCIIKYPKKIYCEYNNTNKKIMVSDGNSLVIKNRNSGIFYTYPLRKTPLGLLLDKNYLISSIAALEPRNIDDKYLVFKIFKKNNTINIFFDKKTYDLVFCNDLLLHLTDPIKAINQMTLVSKDYILIGNPILNRTFFNK